MKQAYITTLNSDSYLEGVLVLAASVKEYCKISFIVMTSDNLSDATYKTLEKFKIDYFVYHTDEIEDQYLSATQNSHMSHWANTFFKLNVFSLVQYDKLVFLDSDMLVCACLDELFELEHMSLAIAGHSFPGNEKWNFNSGLMVVVPQDGLADCLYSLIPAMAIDGRVFGDQDVLQAYYSDWLSKKYLHLDECYNVFFKHLDYYKRFVPNQYPAKVVHFVGGFKPWMWSKKTFISESIAMLKKKEFAQFKFARKYTSYLYKIRKTGLCV